MRQLRLPHPLPVPAAAWQRPAVLLQPRPLILTGLPYQRDPRRRQITRRARLGRNTLLRVSFLATDPRFDLPYGADRALLAWITTRGFHNGHVSLNSVTEYLAAFDLGRGGRNYQRFRQRFQRVASLALRVETVVGDNRQVERLFLVPSSVEPLELAAGRAAGLERKILSYNRYGFDLDPRFWQYLRDTAIPTPLELLRAFHDAPRGWDFAQLLLYRSFCARQPALLPWKDLLEQLGTTDRDPYRLKHRLASTLAKIRRLYPSCPARFRPGLRGLEIHPWRPLEPPAPPGRRTPSQHKPEAEAPDP